MIGICHDLMVIGWKLQIWALKLPSSVPVFISECSGLPAWPSCTSKLSSSIDAPPLPYPHPPPPLYYPLDKLIKITTDPTKLCPPSQEAKLQNWIDLILLSLLPLLSHSLSLSLCLSSLFSLSLIANFDYILYP